MSVVLVALVGLLAGLVAIPSAPAAAASSVTLSKTVSPSTAQPGDEVQYTFDLACSGLTEDCLSATLTDVLPAGLDVVSLPGSSSEQQVTYDESTRTLTVNYTIPLASPPNPAGSVGLPAGATRKVVLSMRVPPESDLKDGAVLTNSASFQGTNTNTATDSTDLTVTIPRIVRPVATKTWSPSSGIAQSGAESTITLGVRNASSTSAEVTQLSLTDTTFATFEKFDVTRIGPVTYPPGADQITIEYCTKSASACPAFDAIQGPLTGTGPFTPPPAIDLGDVTGVRFTFSNSAGGVLPFSPDQGTVQLGMVLRDTLRSTGAQYEPQSRDRVTNTASPAAVDKVFGDAVGNEVSAIYDVNPNIVRSQLTKNYCTDLDLNFACNGTAVAGAGSGVAMLLGGYNRSGFPVAELAITEPDPNVPGAVADFAFVNLTKVRYTAPASTQQTTVVVQCRDGSTTTRTYSQGSQTLDLRPEFCPDGVFPSSVKVSYSGTDANGNGTIRDGQKAGLDLVGTMSTEAPARTYNNCAFVEVSNPVNSSGAGTANGCDTNPLQPPSEGGTGTKSTGQVSTIVPGQPLEFTLTYRNTGNLPVTNVVIVDPVDPTAADNPFDIVRLTRLARVSGPASSLQVYDPQAGAYVAHNASDAALLARATGIRIIIDGQLGAGSTYTARYSVVLRDEVEVPPDGSLTFVNCAAAGVGTPNVTSPFCNNTEITAVLGETGGAVNKRFEPSQLTRPFIGQDPTTIPTTDLRIQVRNDGTLNLSRIVVTDVDQDFFDAYDFRGNIRVNRPPGATHTKVDVCTSVADCSAVPPVFVEGTLTTSTTPGIPAGVNAADVLGFRVTFTRTDGAYLLTPGQNLPTGGNCPSASICVTVAPRPDLRSAPGTPIPDTSENTVSAAGRSLQQDQADPNATFPFGEAPATINVVPGNAAMGITKTPNSRIAPGETAPFYLTIENTGTAPIPELIIEDPIPAGLIFDTAFAGSGPGQPYVLDYVVPDGTPEPGTVEYEAVPDAADPSLVRWRFPGWSFLPGSKVIVQFQVQLEPGTPANVTIPNEARTTSGEPGFEFTCSYDGQVVIDDLLYCTSQAMITSLEGTSFDANKWVAGRDDLGFLNSLTGEVHPTDDARCPQLVVDGRRYTRYPCVALNYPGQGFDFVLRLTNASNNAFARTVRIIDTLPVQGDRGILLNDQQRETEWSEAPRLLSAPRELTTYGLGSAAYSTFDTVAQDICFELQGGSSLPTGCVPADWTAQFPADRESISAVRGELRFDRGLLPGQSALISARVDSPLTLANPTDAPIAWNSFAHEDFLILDGGNTAVLPPTEPIKAGIAILFGKVAVEKVVTNPPAGIDLPPFPVAYECTATPEEPGGLQGDPEVVASGTVNVPGNTTVEIPELLPAGAQCAIWEVDSNGGVSANVGPENAQVITVEPTLRSGADPAPAQLVSITNDFPTSELVIGKAVGGGGEDIPVEGGGAWGDGPFTISVNCVFPDGGQSLEGYPRDLELDASDEVVLTGLPIGAVCTVTEIDDGGASSTIVVVDGGRPSVGIDGSVTIPEGGAEVEVRNVFRSGQLLIRKEIDGDGAGFADRDFVFTVDCALPDIAFAQRTATIERPGQAEVLVEDLPAGAVCVIREVDDGGATGEVPEGGKLVGVVVIEPGETPEVEVTAVNVFPAGYLQLLKQVAGPGAAGSATDEFVLQVRCSRELPDGSTSTFLDRAVTVVPGQSVVLPDPIPVGASCWAQEIDTGGATSVSIDHDSPETAIEVTEENLQAITITATNTFEVGALQLRKALAGAGAAQAAGPFVFDVECTFDGRVTYDQRVSLTLPSLEATLEGLNVGAECTVVEVAPYGGADGPATLTPAGPYTIAAGTQPAVVAATNTFTLGELVVEKVAINEPAGAGPYTFQVECTRVVGGLPVPVDLPDGGFVELAAGEQATFAVPAGSTCTVVEAGVPADVEVSVSDTDGATPGGTSDGVVVVGSAGVAGRAVVTVTNTFPPLGPNEGGTTGNLSETGADRLGDVIGLGGLAILLGAVLLVTTRRRRDGSVG